MLKSKISGVYQIRNLVNRKLYVGSSTTCVRNRLQRHVDMLFSGTHFNRHLQSAWNKYGPKAFLFSLVEECPPSKCLQVEQLWIDKTGAADATKGYNRRAKADSNIGLKWSEVSRAKMSVAKIGGKASDATKKKMSESQLKTWANRDLRAARIAKMRRGVKLPKEVCMKISKAHAGKPLSEFHVAGLKRGWSDPAVKARRVAALKAAWADPVKRRRRLARLRATRGA